MTARRFDVLVVGGGPVGAAVGALLARASGQGSALKVGLLQAVAASAPRAAPLAATPDARVLAISRASHAILHAAGAWGELQSQAFPYERMRIWHQGVAGSGDEVLQFDAAEVGEPNLGYIIEAQRINDRAP